MSGVRVLVGTKKGAFVLTADGKRNQWEIAWPFFGGFMLGYIFYDEIHYATHHAPMKFGWWQKVKHHHVLHHYHDPDKGFGVSSPLWDVVFGTLDPTEQKEAVQVKS